ncbi:MAG: bifunctional oligoribonuclease/PAP phosphatase NrnA [Atopobium sp.]|uniref:DHH family phosphoesterase n=1 Tax=Atopobium sp. TaxID=1872650 RepID=UPI002A7F53F4|nr:bifunctional oligoribonuclease/PAP phosphatase NrnA [Atopobium sp.]MDY4522473.1 bifunctional oligoribonuclease/PAP phosphatase NrnA [Atopobium sp.]
MAPHYTESFSVQPKKFEAITELISDAQTIVICAHTRPDGDALGSGLGLAMLIERVWPGKEVVNLLADDEPIPSIYKFLPQSDRFVPACQYTGTPDLFFMIDLPHPSRLNHAQKLYERAAKRVTIDHHPSEEALGDVCLSRPEVAATGVLITEFALNRKLALTPDIATCLLTAIVTDTGSFQYQNADSEAFEIASLLVDAGANPALISLNVYQSFRLEYLHLASVVMGRIQTYANGRIAYSYATQEDFATNGALPEESEGLIDIVRSVAGSQLALFVKQADAHTVRGNLRSKSELDVSQVASKLGGGGHRVAAGFTYTGTIEEVLAEALPMLQALLEDE